MYEVIGLYVPLIYTNDTYYRGESTETFRHSSITIIIWIFTPE